MPRECDNFQSHGRKILTYRRLLGNIHKVLEGVVLMALECREQEVIHNLAIFTSSLQLLGLLLSVFDLLRFGSERQLTRYWLNLRQRDACPWVSNCLWESLSSACSILSSLPL